MTNHNDIKSNTNPNYLDNGVCSFIDPNTNKTVSTCYSGDVTCIPVCNCNDGYYGASCAVSYRDMVNKQGNTLTYSSSYEY